MFLQSTLFLILLKIVYVLSGGTDQTQSSDVSSSTPNPSTSNQSAAILPLIVIKVGHSPLNPTKLDNSAFVEGTDVLSGATKFSTSPSLSPQGTLFYLCPIKNLVNKSEEPDTSTEFEKVGDEYCVFPIKFESNDKLTCPQEPEPFVSSLYEMKKGPDLPSVPCGENKQGKMHWFVYKTCMTQKEFEIGKLLGLDSPSLEDNPIKYRTHFEVYKLCYDEDNKEILYTKHRIMAPNLLEEKILKNERDKEYPMITDGYEIFKNHFEIIKQQYSQLDDSSPYKIQKLVPIDDFAFALWRKTTCHYLNTKLMRKGHAKLWDYISERIRKRSIELEKQYIIFTGAFTLSRNKKSVAIEGQSKIPDTWIKIIYHLDNKLKKNSNEINNESLAIIMVDNMDDKNVENFYQNSCDKNLCENAFDNDLYSEVSKFVKCCPVTNNINKYFEHEELSKNGVLNAAFLYESADQKRNLEQTIEGLRL